MDVPEDMMDSLIAEQNCLKSTADKLADARHELRNAKALVDEQTLLDSKTHEVEALHASDGVRA